MALTLRWRGEDVPSIDAKGVDPGALASCSAEEIARKPLPAGNTTVELGRVFHVEGDPSDQHLRLEGDLRRVRRIGQGMSSGTLTILGDVGPELGSELAGGTIEVEGNVGDWSGAEMRGGLLRIRGDAGHFLGAAYPGSRLGMRDGVILVDGSVGDDAGLAMRRGLIAIAGSSGEGLGRGLVAGSLFAFGPVGRGAGAGMKRGTLALFGLEDPADPGFLPTFAPSGRQRPHFLTLYLRRLRDWGFPVPEATFSGAVDRYNGDLIERGQGEILVWSGIEPLNETAR